MQEFTIPLTPKDFISGIYYIKCIQNGCIYIGQSKGIYHRLKQHRAVLSRNEHSNKQMQEDFNNGCDFVSGIIQEVDFKTTRYYKEVLEGLYIIEFMQSGCKLYNDNSLYGIPGPDSLQNIKDSIINKMALGTGVRQYTYFVLNN